jgi:hypothetical protein
MSLKLNSVIRVARVITQSDRSPLLLACQLVEAHLVLCGFLLRTPVAFGRESKRDHAGNYFLRPTPPYSQIFDGSPSISPSGRQNGNWTTPGSTTSSPSKNRSMRSRDLSTNGAVASS